MRNRAQRPQKIAFLEEGALDVSGHSLLGWVRLEKFED